MKHKCTKIISNRLYEKGTKYFRHNKIFQDDTKK